MDIIKKLSLNKTPKDVQNGSIVCAKNMMVDDTGSFLTTDTGFDEIELPLKENEFIVGVIPCNNEIAIFTYDGTVSRIYRKFDTGPVHYVKTNWHYEGGKITGTFTYNYKNELVLAVAESGAYKNGVLKNIPLKSFIIHKYKTPIEDPDYEGEIVYYAKPNQTYAIEELTPNIDCNYYIKAKGSLVCGVYTFFIRYKVDKDNYTKWFQITPEINIIRTKDTKCYTHTYLKANDTQAPIITKPSLQVNAEGISDKEIVLDLDFDDIAGIYTTFQLGYIIKVGGDVQGRIQGDYDITVGSTELEVLNNNYIETEPIESFLESPRQLYNVSTLCNYNNRLYLAGYKEYDNFDLSTYATKVRITSGIDVVPNDLLSNTFGGVTTLDLEISLTQSYIYAYNQVKHKADTIIVRGVNINEDGKIVNKQVIIDAIKPVLFLYASNASSFSFYNRVYYLNGLGANYNFEIDTSAHGTNLYLMVQKKGETTNNCICNYISRTYPDEVWLSSWNITISAFDLYFTNNSIVVQYGNNTYTLFGRNADNVALLGYSLWYASEELISEGLPHYYIGSGEGIPYSRIEDTADNKKLPNQIQTSKITTDTDSQESDYDDGAQSGGTESLDDRGVNNRTLIPLQEYNFFIHYIREDDSYTPGYHIGKTSFINDKGNIIVPTFSNIIKPSEYDFKGWFISYEQVERNVDCLKVMSNDSDRNDQKITNAEYMYDLDTVRGNTLIVLNVSGRHDYSIPVSHIEYSENRLLYNHIKIEPKETNMPSEAGGAVTAKESTVYLYKTPSGYLNKAKVLYRCTKNIYDWNYPAEGYIASCTDADYLPDYFNNQILIRYVLDDDTSTGLIVDPAIPKVIKIVPPTDDPELADDLNTTYDVDYIVEQLYSKYPTEAMNIKQDFIQSATVLTSQTKASESDGVTTTDKKDTIVINTIISPDRLHDFLELQSAYKAKPSKVYINYREDNISQFNKTVYRSDVCSDESLVNGFRHFGLNNYKNILENKGSITNIIGIGLYLLIHTEYSLFVFDRSPKLTQRNQLDIPDAFDIDYQEVMPANEGYGGLADKNESIITKHGYIWFDRTSKYIFRYDNGKVDIMSGDINNFIKYIEPTTVRFAEDTIHNRLMICIYYSDGNKFVTLSYNFITNTYISLHDYKFTHNYRTYNKSYVWDENIPNKLYVFTDKHNCNYGALESKQDYIFDCITSEPTEENPNNGDIRPYVDIICNEQPNVNKQLDAISYVLDLIKGSGYSFDIVKPTEENLNRRYSGRELRIYTDETDTENLDIDVKQSAPRREDMTSYADTWRYPVYDKGKWLLNYFRNRINDVVTKSDTKSLIYGKYIVARFIFNKDDRVKLENVTFKINPY